MTETVRACLKNTKTQAFFPLTFCGICTIIKNVQKQEKKQRWRQVHFLETHSESVIVENRWKYEKWNITPELQAERK